MRRLLFLCCSLLCFAGNTWAASIPEFLRITELEFSRDGQRLTATIDRSPWQERLTWATDTGRTLYRRHFEGQSKVVHSPDDRFYMKGDFPGQFWIVNRGSDVISELITRKRVCALEAESLEVITPLTFSPDGNLLAAHSYTPQSGRVRKSVRFWDTRTGKRVRQLEDPQNTMLHADFSADGRQLVAVEQRETDQYVVVRERATGKVIKTFAINLGNRLLLNNFDLSPDGRFLLLTDMDGRPSPPAPRKFSIDIPFPTYMTHRPIKLCLWDLETGTLAHTFIAPQLGIGSQMRGGAPIRTVIFSSTDLTTYHFLPDGTRLQVALFNRETPGLKTSVWDTQTGAQVSRRTLATTSRIYSAAFSPDGKRLAVATTDGKIELRDAFSLAFIRQWDVKLEGEILPPY